MEFLHGNSIEKEMKEEYRNSLIWGMLRRLFSFVFTLGCGYFASTVLDMAMQKDKSGLGKWSLIFAVTLFAGLLLGWILTVRAEKKRIEERYAVRNRQCELILKNRLKISSVGEQEVLLEDVSDLVAEHYQERIPEITEGICIAIGAAVLIGVRDVSLGIIFPAMGLIQILPVFIYRKWAKKIYEESWDADEDLTNWISEGMDGIKTLKSFKAESWFIKHYDNLNVRNIRTGNKSVVTGGIESIIFSAIDALLRYGSYVILGVYVFKGLLRAADIPFMVILSGYVFASMDNLFTFLRYQSTYKMALEKLKDSSGNATGKCKDCLVSCEKICVTIDEVPILQDIDLTIGKNEKVLLQGDNGSGKTTLLRVILGELTPEQGRVRLDGCISACLQEEPELYVPAAGMIEKLALQQDWSKEVFEKTLEAMSFSTVLLEKPITELSGGERKKLFLAIAFARKCDLLILDEPSNHLDEESCGYLNHILRSYSGALLVCTHDARIDMEWDETIHMEGGGQHA